MNDRTPIPAPVAPATGGMIDAYMPDPHMDQVQPRAQFINLAMIRGILFRQRWLIAAVLLLALTCGLVATALETPMFSATSRVEVVPQGSYIVSGQDVDQGVSGNQISDYLATKVEIIGSRRMAMKVAESLNLGERYSLVGEDIDASRPPNLSDEEWLEQKTARAAGIIQDMVSAAVQRRHWIIPISVSSADPVLAAELSNAYADAFVDSDVQDIIERNQYARNYIREQIEEMRVDLQQAELAANEYASANGLITGIRGGDDGLVPTTLTAANLSGINSRVASARVARIEAEQHWLAVKDTPAGQLPEAQSNPVLQSLIAERTTKLGELVELQQRYNDEFPRIQSLQAELAVLNEQIERTGNEIKAALRNEYLVAQRQETALERELSSVTGEKLVEQDKEVEYQEFLGQAAALRDQLGKLLVRYNELASAATVNRGRVIKVDPALVPSSPYAPSLTKNMSLALVFGLALAGALAVLRETIDDRIRSIDHIEEKLGLPLFGHTPFVDQSDMEDINDYRYNALLEAYNSVRTSIDFAFPRSQNLIQFTSSQAAEGKSTTAVIIAELFAKIGRRTLLIDTDLRRPTIAKVLDCEKPKVGLVETVLGHVSLSEAVIKDGHENLDVLPIAEVPPNPADFLSSEQFRNFVERVSEEYDLVIFDSSPVLGLADAPLLAQLVDATLFVVEANKVPVGHARKALRRLARAGGRVAGVVVTKYRALEAGEGYDYQYGYYQYAD
ncbi:MAG: polysaccharide biosynthesis tyrosine autokinase [Erythrobacter sp.]|uniref:GumC family protein n=1 Tax=Erythrobacter sp. TaxID=1042 RepID=UPI002630FFED|nr:polysaccharide biosynthesis tyrosine autokinase [Erythrobacter sp.]MDJ0979368.1 polysaccharide biosynthesis tyrosine autokinase [Erythrobacter sp.]